ncbi:MAG TPA: hypothetical protein VJT31_00830 [Rugosimonospora sp.]|nr:hypothetical protein [Rugosimonospora sp.]
MASWRSRDREGIAVLLTTIVGATVGANLILPVLDIAGPATGGCAGRRGCG